MLRQGKAQRVTQAGLFRALAAPGKPPGLFLSPGRGVVHHTTQNVVIGRTWMRVVLAAMAADPNAALIVTPKIRLSKNPLLSITPQTDIADLEAAEADFTGYTAGGITWTVGVPVNLGPTRVGLQFPVSYVAGTADPFVANTIYGWWADDGTNLIVGEVFVPPLTYGFATQGDFLQLDLVMPVALVLPNIAV